MTRFSNLISDYRELFYALIFTALLLITWWLVPYVDPRVGFDGWSDILYVLASIAAGWLVVLCAWMSKKATHGETTEADDRNLRDAIRNGNTGALRLYLLEMASTAFWVCAWLYIVFERHAK
jgi:hypothetical protein